MFGKSTSPERLIGSLTPEEIDRANGDPDVLADLIVARRGGDHGEVVRALRALFPEQSAPPPRASTAEPTEGSLATSVRGRG
jgi:hypothetical protein